MATPFDGNPTFRKVTYRLQWALNGALVVLGAYFGVTASSVNDLPNWYVVALAVLPVLWTYLGVQADTNTSGSALPPRNEGGYVRAQGGLLHNIGILCIALAVLFFVLSLFHVFAVGVGVGGLVALVVLGLVLIFLF